MLSMCNGKYSRNSIIHLPWHVMHTKALCLEQTNPKSCLSVQFTFQDSHNISFVFKFPLLMHLIKFERILLLLLLLLSTLSLFSTTRNSSYRMKDNQWRNYRVTCKLSNIYLNKYSTDSEMHTNQDE